MSYEELNRRLEQIKIEDFIWLIYIGIIFASWYANYLEKKYFIYNDIQSRKKYRKIMIYIFCVLVVIYLYFLKDSFNDVQNLTSNGNPLKSKLTFLSFIASLLVFISGLIYLYIVINDESVDVEIAFN